MRVLAKDQVAWKVNLIKWISETVLLWTILSLFTRRPTGCVQPFYVVL